MAPYFVARRRLRTIRGALLAVCVLGWLTAAVWTNLAANGKSGQFNFSPLVYEGQEYGIVVEWSVRGWEPHWMSTSLSIGLVPNNGFAPPGAKPMFTAVE